MAVKILLFFAIGFVILGFYYSFVSDQLSKNAQSSGLVTAQEKKDSDNTMAKSFGFVGLGFFLGLLAGLVKLLNAGERVLIKTRDSLQKANDYANSAEGKAAFRKAAKDARKYQKKHNDPGGLR